MNCQENNTERQRAQAREGGRTHILLVDDDDVTVRCVREHLFELGYDVTCVVMGMKPWPCSAMIPNPMIW